VRRAFNLTVFTAVIAAFAVGCGDTVKQPTPADRDALDQFAAGARQWRRTGSEPWNRALSAGNATLATEGPKAEAKMKAAIQKMDTAASGVTDPNVRSSLERLVDTYRAKLKAVHKVDSAGYSLATLKQGLTDLKADGVATQKAWNDYVRQAKKAWDSNPLAGLNVG
jgi:hypothetical protein